MAGRRKKLTNYAAKCSVCMIQFIVPVSIVYTNLLVTGSAYKPTQQHHVIGSIDDFHNARERKEFPPETDIVFAQRLSVPVSLKAAVKRGISTSLSRKSVNDEKARETIRAKYEEVGKDMLTAMVQAIEDNV